MSTIAFLLAGGISTLLVDEGSSTKTQVVVPVICGLAALAIVSAGVLIAQVAAAPYRQRNELRRAWRAPSVEEGPDVELELRNLARQGREIEHRIQRAGGFTNRDEVDLEEWTEKARGFLTEHATRDATRSFVDACRQRRASPEARARVRVASLDRIADDLEDET